ncbi:MAG TPA: tetratricopeptide repeat protein [Pseudomonadales bacterium]|nr:tetratricopeptide repeat protein [Pseudomonadales bacterium]
MVTSHAPLRWLAVSLILALGGCSYTSPDSSSSTPTTTVDRPFPPDALYSLLVAEVAINRGQLDVALANYYQQAYKTRDAGVARRATMLAGYLQADQAALDLAQLWASLAPNNPEPIYIAGQYFIDSGQLVAALQQSKRLLALHASPLFLAIATNPAATEEKTLASLSREYTTLLHDNPDNADLMLGNAALLAANTHYDDSLSLIEKVRAVDQKNLPARLLEVDVLYKSGRPDTAIKHMSDIVNDEPDNDKLRMEYARMLSESDLKKAREQFDYMAQRNSLEPNLLLARAMVNYQLKDYAQAREFFEQLLFLKKNADTAHFYLGEIAQNDHKDSKALEHYRRVEGGSEYLPAVTKAFDLMLQQHHRLEGQQWLAEQRQSHPNDALALYLIEADALFRNSDFPRSLAALNEAIQKYPHQVGLNMARSLVYQKAGNTPAAEADLRLVLTREPDNVDALNALGYLLADSNRQLDEAKKLLERALALQPQDPAILDSMGWLMFRMGQKEEALLRLKKSFALHPNDEVAAHLGEVLWLTGQPIEAKKIWEQGLKLKPNSEAISTVRQRLQAQ